jgi:peptidoglycan/LPS O-acetylase OafA/YrhL
VGSRLGYFDALRGLAALSVVCSHYLIFFSAPAFVDGCCINTPFAFWHDGTAAVQLFFVLSGYVLSYAVAKYDWKNFSLKKYILLRIARIWLPYAVLWLFLASAIYIVRRTLDTSQWAGFFLLPFGQSPSLVPQGWTLSIEVVFSSLLPIVTFVCRRVGVWFALLLLGTGFLSGSAQFIFHFVLGYMVFTHSPTFKPTWAYLIFIIGVFLYTLKLDFYHLDQVLSGYESIITALGTGAMLIGIQNSVLLKQLLSAKKLRYLGKISYSVYLTHFFLLSIPIKALMTFIRQVGIFSDNVLWFGGLVLAVSSVIVFSAGFHRWVETPLVDYSKRRLKNT